MPHINRVVNLTDIESVVNNIFYYDGMPEPTGPSPRKYRGAATINFNHNNGAEALAQELNLAVNSFPESEDHEMFMYDDSVEISFYSPETEAEFEQRKQAFNLARERSRERRREQYLALKEEFENDSD